MGILKDLPIILIIGLLLYYVSKKGLLSGGGSGGGSGGNGTGGNGNGGGGGGGGSGTGTFVHFSDPDDSDICTNASSHGASTVIITGDISKRGDPQGWWDSCTSLHNLNVYVTQGNHDSSSVVNIFPSNAGAWEIAVTLGSIGIVGMNTESLDEQFVTNAIETFQADSNIKVIVVYGHQPVRAPPGSHHGATNTGLHNVFKANSKVKLVLNGHNHNMSVMVVDGIHYVCNGSGDPSKYPVSEGDTVEYANDNDTAVTVYTDSGSSLEGSFISNGGDTLYSFSVPY